MNLFQIAALCILGLLSLAITRSYMRGRMRLYPLLMCWTFILLGALAIMRPNATTVLAQYIGINRGSDLLLYLGVFGGLYITLLGYLRIKILDHQITKLVRQQALDQTGTANHVYRIQSQLSDK